MAKKVVKSVETPAPVVAEPVPVVEEPVVAVEGGDVTKPQSPDVAVSEKFEQLNQKVNDLSSALRDLQTHLRSVQKEIVKLVKTNVKKSKTRSSSTGKKTPSGFAKPTKLTDALCDFLGVARGTELARTDVTRRINLYIKEHDLQDKADKRKIHPDAKLSTVLSLSPDTKLSFFNMQTALKHNFVRA
jgi:chromatin remodeling complex protein RSC6